MQIIVLLYYISGSFQYLFNLLKYRTLLTQEMLKKDCLMRTTTYLSKEHSDNFISDYLESLKSVFKLIQQCEDVMSIDSVLEVQVCQNTFQRLN